MSASSLSSRFALLSAVALIGVACAGRTPVPTTAAPPVAAAPEVQPARSIFDLESTWHSQDGITARLSTLNGGLLVVGMVKTDCSSNCPTTLAAMKAVERATDPSVHMVLVTLDPQHDTPEALAAFAKARGLSASRWTIVSGSNEAINELATVLDIGNRKLTATQLASASLLSVIDPNGVLVQQEGYGNVGDVMEALNLLLAIIH